MCTLGSVCCHLGVSKQRQVYFENSSQVTLRAEGMGYGESSC